MMHAMRTIVLLFLSHFCLLLQPPSTVSQDEPLAVPQEVANQNLINKVEPVVPPLAKLAGVGGKVVADITISPEGNVESVKFVSGHPILVQSAIDAIKQWKYRPFLKDSQPTAAKTRVEVSFASAMSEHERLARQEYFPVLRKCMELVNAGNYSQGEKTCSEAVRLSEKLPPDVVAERSPARTFLGHSLLLQGRVKEAIRLYSEVLELDEKHRKPNDADLASDYANLGRAYFRSGDLDKADGLYSRAVETFEAAIVNLPSMKENYTRRLKNTLKEYARLKRAKGQEGEAEKLERKSSSF